jgi:prepilin-type N-terminal cleavage/methylation domain-containing protein/prepilin-type processing-associated H-X9-DG protein
MTAILRAHRLRGFTLVEVLVVIRIIGVLVGLLLPAVQSAREAGRRTQCENNMKNIALGILGYVQIQGKFPPAGVFTDDPNKQNSPQRPLELGTRNMGIGSWHDPLCTPDSLEVPMYNWVVEILPFIDQVDLANAWSRTGQDSSGATVPLSYLSTQNVLPGQPSNYKIGSTSLAILRCPDDTTALPGQGNLSYVVNGGFCLWPALPLGWTGSAVDGASTANNYQDPTVYSGLLWTSKMADLPGEVDACRKLGVMFLEDYGPFGPSSQPATGVSVRTTIPAIVDGTTNTVLLSENTLAGAGPPSIYSKNVETNWATPLANFCLFIGSDNVCESNGSCYQGGLMPQTVGLDQADGPMWSFANKLGTFENINYGQNLTTKGSFPFSNSGHPGGCNMAFCDGAVHFISATIDGTVYSKILTSSGSRLPRYARQLPLSQDDFAR